MKKIYRNRKGDKMEKFKQKIVRDELLSNDQLYQLSKILQEIEEERKNGTTKYYTAEEVYEDMKKVMRGEEVSDW